MSDQEFGVMVTQVAPRPAVRITRVYAMAGIAVIGALIAAYLTWVHVSGNTALCVGAGGCEQVQASRFATVRGIPVAGLGLGLWGGLLALTLAIVKRGDESGTLTSVTFALAVAGALYSAYLTSLEVAVIGAICPWCVAAAVLMAAFCALATLELLGRVGPGDRHTVRRRARRR